MEGGGRACLPIKCECFTNASMCLASFLCSRRLLMRELHMLLDRFVEVGVMACMQIKCEASSMSPCILFLFSVCAILDRGEAWASEDGKGWREGGECAFQSFLTCLILRAFAWQIVFGSKIDCPHRICLETDRIFSQIWDNRAWIMGRRSSTKNAVRCRHDACTATCLAWQTFIRPSK